MILRILLFSTLSTLLLYIPFYHFAPIYRSMYAHVPNDQLTWWVVWAFEGEHGGIQLYVAYVLMFLAIGLTALFEYVYNRFSFRPISWIVLSICLIDCLFYLLFIIGFHPPMSSLIFWTYITPLRILFIEGVLAVTVILGYFFDRKEIKWLSIFFLVGICMIPVHWSYINNPNYVYFFAPALRMLKGCALNQTYFQYDHLLTFLAAAWMKLSLPLDKFYIILELSFLVFFIGMYVMAKNLFLDKRLAIYFIISLVLIKTYGNLDSFAVAPQFCPLRLDLWLILLALCYWKSPQHWTVGLTLGFFLIFHHAFGMIYSISYLFFILVIFAIDILKNRSGIAKQIKEIGKYYLPNICIMISGELISQLFISSDKTAPALNYLKYNIGFMPISPESFFWYVPIVMNAVVLLLWKSRTQLPQRYFQTGIFLVLLAIGNLLYFFGRSHENNLINIAGSLWLIFFMLIDLSVYRVPEAFRVAVKRIFVPLVGVGIVGLIALFYCRNTIGYSGRLKLQVFSLCRTADFFKDNKKWSNWDFNAVRAVTHGNRNIVFLSVLHDAELYYYGGYTPPDFSPINSCIFLKDLVNALNASLLKGADIIVPSDEADSLKVIMLDLKFKYMHRVNDFILISNHRPAFGPGLIIKNLR